MATATQIEEFRAASNTLVDLALNDLLAMWRPFVLRATPTQARETLLAVMPDLVASYGQTAAVLGVDWYDLLRGDVVSAPSASRLGVVPSSEQVQATVRWAVGPLWDGNPESAFSNLSGAMQRLILSGLRDSIDQSARADASTGRVAAVSWARHTRPALAKSGKSCDFCVMLAGRGPVYRSSSAAGAVVGRGSTRTGLDDAGNRLGGGIGGGIKARGTQALAASYHDNCVVPGTWVSGPASKVGYRRYYEGEVVTLVTAAGHELSITPKHPVLTDRGWVPAGMLNLGDHLLSALSGERNVVSGPDEHHVPSRIEDVVRSLGVVGTSGFRTVPGAAEQFHGDGFNSEVHVVSGDHLLRGEADSGLVQPGAEGLFHGAAVPGSFHGALGTALSHLQLRGSRHFSPSSSGVRVCDECAATVGVEGLHAEPISASVAASLDSEFVEPSGYDTTANPEGVGERKHAFSLAVTTGNVGGRGDAAWRAVGVGRKFDPTIPYGDPEAFRVFAELGADLRERLSGSVHLDRLVDKRVGQYHGDVLNLETMEGWYSANGITVSNCHCVAEPTFYGLEDRDFDVRGYTQTLPTLVPLK